MNPNQVIECEYDRNYVWVPCSIQLPDDGGSQTKRPIMQMPDGTYMRLVPRRRLAATILVLIIRRRDEREAENT